MHPGHFHEASKTLCSTLLLNSQPKIHNLECTEHNCFKHLYIHIYPPTPWNGGSLRQILSKSHISLGPKPYVGPTFGIQLGQHLLDGNWSRLYKTPLIEGRRQSTNTYLFLHRHIHTISSSCHLQVPKRLQSLAKSHFYQQQPHLMRSAWHD